MASLSIRFCILAFFCATLFVITNTCLAKLAENHAALFVFGDSLFDAGNNNYIHGASKYNLWPYGESFFCHPTGRPCDGRIVPDFIAEYANLPLIKPYLQPGFENYTDGVNFASAGAGVLPETNEEVLNLELQLSYFEEVEKKLKQQLGDAAAKKLLSKSVYLFSIGGNDYNTFLSSVNNPTSSEMMKFMTMVLGNFTTGIKKVYKMGGRKFGFQNIGPVGCMPATKAILGISSDCDPERTVMAEMHNTALAKVLKKIQGELPEFKYALYDYYTTLAARTLYSTKFGFEVGKNACCGTGPYNGLFTCGGKNGASEFELCSNPREYVWFDAGHPTESANIQLANLFWNGHPNITEPYNLKKLFDI